MEFPSKEIVRRIRDEYPPGTRVELISMNDPYTEIPAGTQGKVKFVDDAGTIFVAWSCGSGLGVVYGVDKIKRVGEANDANS